MDYRTRWSGLTKNHMKKAIPIQSALSQIANIIKVSRRGREINPLYSITPKPVLLQTLRRLLVKAKKDLQAKIQFFLKIIT